MALRNRELHAKNDDDDDMFVQLHVENARLTIFFTNAIIHKICLTSCIPRAINYLHPNNYGRACERQVTLGNHYAQFGIKGAI